MSLAFNACAEFVRSVSKLQITGAGIHFKGVQIGTKYILFGLHEKANNQNYKKEIRRSTTILKQLMVNEFYTQEKSSDCRR